MKIGVQYFVPRDLRNKLAGKDAQDFWVKTIVAPRMKKYMPARDKQEPEKQLTIVANSPERYCNGQGPADAILILWESHGR